MYCERAAVRALASQGAEELDRAKISVLVDVDVAGLLVQLHEVLAHEEEVALVLLRHVILHDVVEAAFVAGIVVAQAAAADGVLDLDGVLLRVMHFLSVEDDLRAVFSGAVVVVVIVGDVPVGDAVSVDRMPTVPWILKNKIVTIQG